VIQLYVGSSMIGEYHTQGMGGGGVFTYEKRTSEYQPPGSYELVVEGDGVDKVTPFNMNFGIAKTTIPNAMYALVELRLKLQAATSLKHVETNQWRALKGGQDTIKVVDDVPLSMSREGLHVWFFKTVLRPKFGKWTNAQAETLQDYLLYRDQYPFEPGNVPFSDWTYWSDGTGWSS
jgi:hypothetical protein